jgi:hypothetical protein
MRYPNIHEQRPGKDILRNIGVAHFNVLFGHLLEIAGNSTKESLGKEVNSSKIKRTESISVHIRFNLRGLCFEIWIHK